MPKLGMKPIRRAALLDTTSAEIGNLGTLDITVSQIAKSDGMSSGFVGHYFGGKEQIVLAVMRYTLVLYAVEVCGVLSMASTPQYRIETLVHASFSPCNFQCDVIAAGLNFYVMAQSLRQVRHLLNIY